ncbi:MAG TPA: DUF92 domain-containing protein [Chitinophagaceae bacterium]
METTDWLIIGVLLAGMFLSVYFRKLDLPGALTGGLLAGLIYLGAGFTGIALMSAFFILGTLATGHKMTYKESLKAAEKSQGKRNAIQVFSNAGIPALCGLLAWIFPENASVFRLMLAAGFSSATADTLSSELGTVYGKKFYNILTFQPDRRGLDGVVSIEGTLLGALGSIAMALIFSIEFGFHYAFLWIFIAGIFGNWVDSVMGATLQRHHYLSNNGVNLFNTILAGLVAGLLTTLE